jgi:dTDP-4-dehydrorhamnose reductase
MKVLIAGAAGMLGTDVTTVARAQGHEVVALDRDELDVTDPRRVERVIRRHRPAAVINCAAWTDVDAAEEHEKEAEIVNGEGAHFLADAGAKLGAKVLYVSTDYVFDGTKKGPYTESDEPDPINAYGRTKLAGERATALVTKRSFIVRTSWLFGPPGGNFVETMLRLGEGGGPVVVVHDQVGCPTYTGHLANGLVRLIETEAFGVHHMSGRGSCSWYEFALEIFRQSGVVTRVMATTTDMMERPARRPENSVLGSGREAPIELPGWQRGLADYLARRDQPDTEEQAPARRAGSTAHRQPALDTRRGTTDDDPTEESGGASASPTPASPPGMPGSEAEDMPVDGMPVDGGETEDMPVDGREAGDQDE